MSYDISTTIQELYTKFGELSGIAIEIHKNLLAVSITNDSAEATIFLQGAQLSHFQCHGEQPTIWLSPSCDYKEGKPLRGGIPICWPWFGDLKHNPAIIQQQITSDQPPSHGIVRTKPWQLDSISLVNTKQTEVVLTLKLDTNEDPRWPFACELRMQFTISDTLEMDFSVRNTDERPFSFSSALHSYFAVSTIEHTSISGLEHCQYLDCLEDWRRTIQQGEITIDQEVDRLYDTQGRSIHLKDRHWKRQLTIQSNNSRSAIIWNPWIEKTLQLDCFNDKDYQSMLCIESANAAHDLITLEPQHQHNLKTIITMQPLTQ